RCPTILHSDQTTLGPKTPPASQLTRLLYLVVPARPPRCASAMGSEIQPNDRFEPFASETAEAANVRASAAFRNAIVTSPFFGSGGELIAPTAIHYFR